MVPETERFGIQVGRELTMNKRTHKRVTRNARRIIVTAIADNQVADAFDAMTCVLADLRHFSEQHDLSFEKAVRDSCVLFSAERMSLIMKASRSPH